MGNSACTEYDCSYLAHDLALHKQQYGGVYPTDNRNVSSCGFYSNVKAIAFSVDRRTGHVKVSSPPLHHGVDPNASFGSQGSRPHTARSPAAPPAVVPGLPLGSKPPSRVVGGGASTPRPGTASAGIRRMSASQDDALLDDTMAVVVLHIDRRVVGSRESLCQDWANDDQAMWGAMATTLFTPRGLSETFSIDLEGLRWRALQNAPGSEVYEPRVYTFNGRRAHALAIAAATAVALDLERLTVHDTGFTRFLFHNGASSSPHAGLLLPVDLTDVLQAVSATHHVKFHHPENGAARGVEDGLPMLMRHVRLFRDLFPRSRRESSSERTQGVAHRLNDLKSVVPASGSGRATASTPDMNTNGDSGRSSLAPLSAPRGPAVPNITLNRRQIPNIDVAGNRHGPHHSNGHESPGTARDQDDADPSDARVVKLRQAAPVATEVLPYLFVGGEMPAADQPQLIRHRITHICNCAHIMLPNSFPNLFEYLALRLSDSPDEHIFDLFPFVVAFVERAFQMGGRIFIHCNQGVSRSCSFVIAYIMWKQGLCYDAAYAIVRKHRTICSPNPGFMVRLMNWERRLRDPEAVVLFRYDPYSIEYPTPFIFKDLKLVASLADPSKRVDRDVDVQILDPRNIYLLAMTSRAQPRALMLIGDRSPIDLIASAKEAAKTILLFGFYGNKQSVSEDRHGNRVTFETCSLPNSLSAGDEVPTMAFSTGSGVPTAACQPYAAALGRATLFTSVAICHALSAYNTPEMVDAFREAESAAKLLQAQARNRRMTREAVFEGRGANVVVEDEPSTNPSPPAVISTPPPGIVPAGSTHSIPSLGSGVSRSRPMDSLPSSSDEDVPDTPPTARRGRPSTPPVQTRTATGTSPAAQVHEDDGDGDVAEVEHFPGDRVVVLGGPSYSLHIEFAEYEDFDANERFVVFVRPSTAVADAPPQIFIWIGSQYVPPEGEEDDVANFEEVIAQNPDWVVSRLRRSAQFIDVPALYVREGEEPPEFDGCLGF